ELLIEANAAIAVQAGEAPFDAAATGLVDTHRQVAIDLRITLQAGQGEALAPVQRGPGRRRRLGLLGGLRELHGARLGQRRVAVAADLPAGGALLKHQLELPRLAI